MSEEAEGGMWPDASGEAYAARIEELRKRLGLPVGGPRLDISDVVERLLDRIEALERREVPVGTVLGSPGLGQLT